MAESAVCWLGTCSKKEEEQWASSTRIGTAQPRTRRRQPEEVAACYRLVDWYNNHISPRNMNRRIANPP